LLRCDNGLSCGDPDAGNLLVEGDNLLALKALLPYYAGQVKCIYIDPPYNTGNEKWVYNDNVSSPEMRKWLGKVVGGEAEDLSRHDKWLCMMYPRLALLRDFLREDGVVLISIDDNEFERLKLLMGEIFGASNHVATFIWKRRTTPDSRNLNGVSGDHEYVLCYKRGAGFRVKGQVKDLTKYSNPDNDPRGPWMSDNLTGLANRAERPNLHYDIVHPVTGEHFPPHPSRGWIYGPGRMAGLIAEDRILWPKKAGGRPRLKRYISDMQTVTTGFSTVLDAPGNVDATKELGEIMGPKAFAFPKPSELIALLIDQCTQRGDLVLDSFVGSGTTGHAVLRLNHQDDGNRRFVLVEMEPKIAREISAERIKRVAQGYTNAKGEAVSGLGGGFRYCRLDKPLFDEQGRISAEVKFVDLAAHVFFTETGSPIPKQASARSSLLGRARGTAYYLLFNGVLGDKTPDGGNVLTAKVLAGLATHNGPKVIFGEGCRLSDARLKREQITFKQLPYEIKVS
jgi:site-specific DNA-methyltransferase (adenine-specific)/adenine-specific DNA-methyltransferase